MGFAGSRIPQSREETCRILTAATSEIVSGLSIGVLNDLPPMITSLVPYTRRADVLVPLPTPKD
jgi:hypothetical protein